MNALPKRRYYSFDEAAEQLGLTIGDLLYHLKEGNIHYFLPGRLFRSATPIPYEDLPNKTVDQINHLAKHPHLFTRTFVDAPNHVFRQFRFTQHEFYWMPHRNPPEYLTTSDPHSVCKVFLLALTTGMPVGFFNEYSVLEAIPIGKIDNNGIPVEAVITAEEIERRKEAFSTNDAPLDTSLKPFKKPLKVDDICEAMVELGNVYYEQNNKIPKSSLYLRKFMLSVAEEYDWEVIDKPDNRKDHIKIEGEVITYDAFNKRFNKYLDDNGR
jgi:hypothetical protein